MNGFPDRLRYARKEARLTQENLAHELGISKTQISAWENGREMPKLGHLSKLKSVLSVSLDWLFDDLLRGAPAKQVRGPDQPTYLDQSSAIYASKLLGELDEHDRQIVIRLMSRLRKSS